ncbi:pentapeptide repeat-containing protein [Naumannella halotolerans]|uniref:Pentapeptide repeat protein n=1 Tax=Naumannella halotolerans TaxID=993414 RepID=A0A4R7J457_9ACTN|nr:pentapeptide repeat-containing protein [Naumannella halotolerans]TDT31133.1 pentapeptide repeat protein [Naumannella halotolerans]
MSDYSNLLDVITKDRELPDGWDTWGIKSTRPDLTTRNGFQWPFPGGVAEAPNMLDHNGSCPREEGDGLCVATTWAGMASGGFPARTLLLVAYNMADARGDQVGKCRVPRVAVVDLVDGERLVRDHGANSYLRGANLSGANLRGADLSEADLRGADLSGADLSGADLSEADLRGAYLSGADLSDANLSRANLSRANLSGADLSGANLSDANLSRANLSRANLSDANLSRANLSRANLSEANLSRANLSRANLSEAYLSGAYLSGHDVDDLRSRGAVIV